MSLLSSARSFWRRVRTEGVRSIPSMVYTRWMTLVHRDRLRQEAAERAAQEEAYQAFIARHTQPEETPFATALTLSFLIPTWNTDPALLNALADSLLAQSCPCWEACLYDGASTHADTRSALQALEKSDPRFRVVMGTENGGISGNTNAAFAFAAGDVIALCDHDDLLAPDAVRCILRAAEKGADFIYTDEDKVSADGTRFFGPHLKPDFSPDALRSGNYICHITAMTRQLAEALVQRDGSLLRCQFDGSQDHDLALRATEISSKVTHIPRILYHWRMLDGSFSHQRAEKCALSACAAVTQQLQRLGIPAKTGMERLRTRIWYHVPETSVTAIVLGEGSVPTGPDEVIRVSDASALNDAARQARGEYLLFLAGGLTPMNAGLLREFSMYASWDKGWLNELLMYAQRPDVGCVGSAILDRQRFYLHAGYAVDVPGGAVSHHAGQWYYGRPYEVTDRIVRNVTGVSSALLLIRREVFLSLGGFGDYASDLRGADLGLKCLQAGLVNVYTPHARMVEGIRNLICERFPTEDVRRFRDAWGEHPQEHYYSPLFTRDGRMTIDLSEKEER
ncbi:MAG: glycosyltransferase [Clostridia bacterium]|nr:glycosyltransferase [Clostridia bacterium]